METRSPNDKREVMIGKSPEEMKQEEHKSSELREMKTHGSRINNRSDSTHQEEIENIFVLEDRRSYEGRTEHKKQIKERELERKLNEIWQVVRDNQIKLIEIDRKIESRCNTGLTWDYNGVKRGRPSSTKDKGRSPRTKSIRSITQEKALKHKQCHTMNSSLSRVPAENE